MDLTPPPGMYRVPVMMSWFPSACFLWENHFLKKRIQKNCIQVPDRSWRVFFSYWMNCGMNFGYTVKESYCKRGLQTSANRLSMTYMMRKICIHEKDKVSRCFFKTITIRWAETEFSFSWQDHNMVFAVDFLQLNCDLKCSIRTVVFNDHNFIIQRANQTKYCLSRLHMPCWNNLEWVLTFHETSFPEAK